MPRPYERADESRGEHGFADDEMGDHTPLVTRFSLLFLAARVLQ